LSRTEQEQRYQQVLTANPKDVDALCGYACFLSTVKVCTCAALVGREALKPPTLSPQPHCSIYDIPDSIKKKA
jgi:hypothetical protein